MKVKLTNISYSVNYCRLEGVSPKLMDFITVHFDPPGSMSAGMTCHMQVIFKPQVSHASNNNYVDDSTDLVSL